MQGAGRRALGTRARIAILVMCAFALSACETPYSIFWDASHRGQNNLITPSGRINVKLPSDYCNENALSQFPDHPDLFVGRTALTHKGGTPCDGASWALGLWQMDWSTFALSRVQTIVSPGAKIQGGNITLGSTFDPGIVKFNGEYWIAFECYGTNDNGNQRGGSCIGPFDLATKRLDTDRTTLAISEDLTTASGAHSYSASQPKLLVFGNKLYLYSSMVDVVDNVFRAVHAKGALLHQESTGKKRMWVSGATNSVLVEKQTEVWTLGTDAQSNSVADLTQITSDGTTIYALGNVGGGPTCAVVDVGTAGCYRFAIARSTDPLSLNRDRIPDSDLPGNTIGYPRLIHDPGGTLYLLSNWQPAAGATTNPVAPAELALQKLPPLAPTVHEFAVNGSFERGGTGWASDPSTNFVVYPNASIAHDGTNYGATNTSVSGGGIHQDIPIAIGPGRDPVTATAWVRAQDPGTATGQFCAWGYDASAEPSCTGYSVDNSGWQQVEVVLNPTLNHAWLRLQVYAGAGTTLIDTVSVRQERSVANGSFDAGWTGWSQTEPSPKTNFVVYTSSAIAHDGTRYGATNSTVGGAVFQDVYELAGDRTIVASAWVRAQEGPGASGKFCVFGTDASIEGTCTPYNVGPTTWQHVEVVLNPAVLHGVVRVAFYPLVGTTLFDTVSVHKEHALTNGSFEGGWTGWSEFGASPSTNFVVYIDAANAHDGGRYGATNTSVGGSIYQDASLRTGPSDPALVSAWVQAQEGPGASGKFCAWGLDGTPEPSCTNYNVGPSGWQQVQVVLNPTQIHTRLRVQFYPYAGTTRIDTVTAHR